MTKRIIGIAITVLGACLVPTPAPASVGHTIRNGGGDAELAFVNTWSALSRYLNVCLDGQSPCGLKPEEQRVLNELLSFQRRCHPRVLIQSLSGQQLSSGICGEPLRVNSSLLYDDQQQAKGPAALVALALEILMEKSCAGRLSSVNFISLSESRAAIQYFSRLNADLTVIAMATQSGHQLSLKSASGNLGLSAFLAAKAAVPGQAIQILHLGSRMLEQRVEIRGVLQAHGLKPTAFSLLIGQDLNLEHASLIFEP